MHNHKVTSEIERRQSEMFGILINIFTPDAEIEKMESKTGAKNRDSTSKGLYTVTSMVNRRECTVKEGKTVLFELYLDEEYMFATRGKFLKRLVMNESLIERVRAALTYHENYDMKHIISGVSKEDAQAICKAFITRDERYDNGLVQLGEIENSKRVLPKMT